MTKWPKLLVHVVVVVVVVIARSSDYLIIYETEAAFRTRNECESKVAIFILFHGQLLALNLTCEIELFRNQPERDVPTNQRIKTKGTIGQEAKGK